MKSNKPELIIGHKRLGRFVLQGVSVFTVIAGLAFAPVSVFAGEEPAKKLDPTKLQARKVDDTKKVEAKKEDARKVEDPKAPVDPNAPHGTIKPDEEIHEFGTTWVGETLKHTFKIKNEGNAALEITKVQPGCGCTSVGSHPNKIEAGETGEFSFSLNSSKLNGPYEKMITVTSNDPSNPNLKLKLKGDVKQYVSVVPTAANFGKVFGGEPQERVLKITNNTDKPLELTMDAPPADSKFKFELVETEKGKAYDLKVSLNAPGNEGNLNTQIALKTNNDAQKQIDINALATVPPRIEVQPMEVTVSDPGAAKAGTPAPALTRLVRFTNYGKDPVKVTEATSDDPEIQLSIQERQPDKEYTVQVNIPVGYKVPDAGRTITLKTNDKEKPTITIPVKGPAKPAEQTKQLSPAEQKVGNPSPAFALKTIEGKPLSNSDTTITVLDFFAPNCGFCKKQIPRMQPIVKEYQAKGVRFVNVSEKMRKDFTQQEIVDILNDACKEVGGLAAELALDMENQVGPLFGANSYPTMVILGKTGKVEAVNSGNIADLESKLKSQLDDLLAGKTLPKPDATKTVSSADQPKQEAPKPATELVGKPAPKFAIKTLDGKEVGDSDFSKHPATVLNFVAPNCGFCKKQVPKVDEVRKEYEAKGIRFVNVVQKMGTKEFSQDEIKDIFKQAGSQIELALDSTNSIGQQYKAMSFPTMVIVDKKGNVDQVHIGAKPDIDATLKTQLDNLIAGKSNATAPAAGVATPTTQVVPVQVTPIEVKPSGKVDSAKPNEKAKKE